jgi:hypothetical protein
MLRNEISIEMEFCFRRRYILTYVLTYIFPCVRALPRRQLMIRRSASMTVFSVVKAFQQLAAPTLPLKHLI